MAKTPDPSELSAYDVEALVRTFDILRSAGRLDAFIQECRASDVKIYVSPEVAESTRRKLVETMPALRATPDRFTEIFGQPPHVLLHAPDECPACPFR